MERVIDVCGKRITEYILQALSWFNRGEREIRIRGIGEDSSRVVQISTILQDVFHCELENSEVGYFHLNGSKTPYLEVTLSWKDEKRYPMKYTPYMGKFMDFPIYQLIFDRFLFEGGKLTIDAGGVKIGEIKEHRGILSFTRAIDKSEDEEKYFAVRDVLYRSGMLLPENWREITDVLSRYDDVILGVDTNILLHASISEHLIPILHLYNPIAYANTPNWLLFVIPSTVMYELESFANIREEGKIKRYGRRGFRALEEIIELNEGYDLTGLSLIIVGETDPVLETKAELQGLRQDIRLLAKAIGRDKSIPFSKKSSSGDIIIRDQFKNFLRKIDFHKGVYFLTSDKSNAALADAEGLHSLYLKIPGESALKEKTFSEIRIEGEPEVRLGVPVGKLIYEFAVEFGEITVEFRDAESKIDKVNLSVDLWGERIDHWLNRRLHINEYEFKKLIYSDGFVYVDKVMGVWRDVMD